MARRAVPHALRQGVLGALLALVLVSGPGAPARAGRAPARHAAGARPLVPGARGPAVRRLWRVLYRLHYIARPTRPPRRYDAALILGVRRFEWVARLAPDPVVDRGLWRRLEGALAEGRALAPDAPNWLVVVRESRPESVTVYLNGRRVLETPANTGVAGAATPLGAFFVFEKLPFQVMRGVNVNGTPYADPVHDIWYFVGGDALHGFTRAAYGFPQSNGCVEVPPDVAASLYARLPVGAEVDVVS